MGDVKNCVNLSAIPFFYTAKLFSRRAELRIRTGKASIRKGGVNNYVSRLLPKLEVISLWHNPCLLLILQ